MLFFRRRRAARASPRMRLLELAVNVRYTISRLGLVANRLRATYQRTGDRQLEEMLRRVLVIQAALEALSVRLETLASVGIVSGEALKSAKTVLEEIRARYGGVQPMIDSMLLELENAVTALAADSGVEVEHTLAPAGERPVDEEVKRILEAAKSVAEERLREMTATP